MGDYSFTRLKESFPDEWTTILTTRKFITRLDESIGFFYSPAASLPFTIIGTNKDNLLELAINRIDFQLPYGRTSCAIWICSKLLKLNQVTADPINIMGWMKRIRIVFLIKGVNQHLKVYRMYVGIIADLDFDIGRWQWGSTNRLLNYSTKLGWKQLKRHEQLTRTIPQKWSGTLPLDYVPRWHEVWKRKQPKKEAAFLWSVYHKPTAVNHCKA
jgi:hypothetical protein